MVTRSALLYLSRHEGLKDFAVRFRPFKKMTRRFVAGEDIEEAIAAIREINKLNCTASFDHLNESVANQAETQEEVREYLRILTRIDETGIRSNVSIKLTQFGLDIDPELTYKNARTVVEEAARRGNFVRVDMEQSSVTEVTIDIFKRLRAEFGLNDVGIVLQSYLRRTYTDAQELLKIPARIRICKGAYNEPPEVAFPDKKDVDDNYIRVMKLLLSSGTYHGIATHDPNMINTTIRYARDEGIGKEAFEFQMLYGVRRDLQERLARDGYNVRVYVPYGKHWYPYFMRRLAERPANVWFVLKNMFKG
ncbi:MAG TPA: proline dehydrogenase family protein [Pyrinomonadaceae bacterium]|jgi:proline dehydrogenase|nr:proline dehydrogenase family protein [Pyrinomonadaceae bacterium]